MILKVFTQPNCPKCRGAKELCAELKAQGAKLKTAFFDTSTVDGLAEAAFYQVLSTPSLILLSDKGKIIAEWRGRVPSQRELKKF